MAVEMALAAQELEDVAREGLGAVREIRAIVGAVRDIPASAAGKIRDARRD